MSTQYLEYKVQLEDRNTGQDEKDKILEAIRKGTAEEKCCSLQEIIDSGLVPILVAICNQEQISQASQNNILWALTNICSGNEAQTQAVINSNGIDLFLKYCDHNSLELVIQSLWGIGNIVGDSIQNRDLLLSLNVLQIVCRLLERSDFLESKDIGTLAWVLFNLVRGKPNPNYEIIKPYLPTFVKLLKRKEEEILSDLVWGFANISDDSESHEDFISQDIITSLLPCQHINKLQVCLIRTIGNLTAGSDKMVDYIIERGCVQLLIDVFNLTDKQVAKKEAAWSLSNIAAGNIKQQLFLLEQQSFVQLLEQILLGKIECNLQVLTEFQFVIGNLYAGKKIVIEALNKSDFRFLWARQTHIMLEKFGYQEKPMKVFLEGYSKQLKNSSSNFKFEETTIIRKLISQLQPHLPENANLIKLSQYFQITDCAASEDDMEIESDGEDSNGQTDSEEQLEEDIDKMTLGDKAAPMDED